MDEAIDKIFEEALEKVNQKIEDRFKLEKEKAKKKVQEPEEEIEKKKEVVPVEDESIQYSYDLYVEMLGMMNAFMFLLSKGKVGPILNKQISAMILRLTEVRKYYNGKNVNIDGKNRSKMLNTKRKMDSLMTTQILPLLSDRDRQKLLRLQTKFTK